MVAPEEATQSVELFNRAMNAIALELPAAVYRDFTAIVWARVSQLEATLAEQVKHTNAVHATNDDFTAEHTARLAAEQERDALRIAERRLRHAGGLLANVAFNLAQRSTLSENERRALDESRQAWDVEAAATRRPAIVADPSVPPGEVHVRDSASGKLLGKIMNVDGGTGA